MSCVRVPKLRTSAFSLEFVLWRGERQQEKGKRKRE